MGEVMVAAIEWKSRISTIHPTLLNLLGCNPKNAVQLGYHQHEEAVEDRTVDGIRRIIQKCQEFSDRVTDLLNSANELSSKEKLYSRLLKREVQFCLKWKDHKGYLLAEASFLNGLQTSLPRFFGSKDILRLVRENNKGHAESKCCYNLCFLARHPICFILLILSLISGDCVTQW